MRGSVHGRRPRLRQAADGAAEADDRCGRPRRSRRLLKTPPAASPRLRPPSPRLRRPRTPARCPTPPARTATGERATKDDGERRSADDHDGERRGAPPRAEAAPRRRRCGARVVRRRERWSFGGDSVLQDRSGARAHVVVERDASEARTDSRVKISRNADRVRNGRLTKPRARNQTSVYDGPMPHAPVSRAGTHSRARW